MNSKEHLLVVLAEECGEVAKEACKGLRFGLEDRNVLNPTGPMNRERLVSELNDLMGVIHMCVREGIIPKNWDNGLIQVEKRMKVLKFMDYARKVGALQDTPKPKEQP